MLCGILLSECDPDAAFIGQESQSAPDCGVMGPVHDLASVAFLHHQPGIHERAKVMGKRRWRQAHMRADLTNRQAILSGAHQKAKHAKPGLMAKGGKRMCDIVILHHATQYNYISSFVKR